MDRRRWVFLGSGGGNGDTEEGAGGFCGEYLDEAVVGLDEFLDQGQAESDAGGFAASFVLAAVEFVEDFFTFVMRDAWAAVFDLDPEMVPLGAGADRDGFIIGGSGVF